MTATGYALCTGLNSVDPGHYSGWSGPLTACEFDANDMARLLSRRGFQVTTLLTAAAKRGVVLGKLRELASLAKPGDLVAFTNSSHGGQLPDLNADEDDGADETLCMFDGELVDDELFHALGAFAAGVRVLIVSDSCHSGTVARMMHTESMLPGLTHASRALPPDVALATYHANGDFYDAILSRPELREAKGNLKASVMLISGCQDNQTSLDGTYNGLFTGTLLKVWNAGTFTGNYRTFRNRIVSRMPPDQTPNLFWASDRCAKFEAQVPFTIGTKLDLASVRGVVTL